MAEDHETTRITLTISVSEAEALQRVADAECRPPRDQARLLLRQALEVAEASVSRETPPRPEGEA